MKQYGYFSGILVILVLLTGIISAKDNENGARTGFNVQNLNKIPSYERYVFSAEGTTFKEAPVVIEYTVKDNGKKNALWVIKGEMPINKTFIEEQYTVRLEDLNVLAYSRTQKFDRGTHKTSGKLAVNTHTGQPDEFIVSTLQAIMYLLRTYPLDSNLKEIYVRAPQQTKGKMNLKIKNKGLKKVKTVRYGEINAYNLEVSLVVPVVGAFLPNIDYYFLDDDVHTLVAMKGSFSMTGKNMEVQLVSYTSRP